MSLTVIYGLLIPLAGTMLGSACVFFMRRQLRDGIQRALTGFASGVMTAASIWSLLIPAMDQVSGWGVWAFFPAAAGFWLGILFLLLLDHLIPHLHQRSNQTEGLKSHLGHRTMLTLAVTLHNIPEGMAVGVAFGSLAHAPEGAALSAACMLALGVGIQNFPEGAAVSLPLLREGLSRRRAFFLGQLSAVVEPLAGVAGALLVMGARMLLPGLLSFAAGAMLYVAVAELIPESLANERRGLMAFATLMGFALMMVLDVALG